MTVEEAIKIIKKRVMCRKMPIDECYHTKACHLCQCYCTDEQLYKAIDILIKAVTADKSTAEMCRYCDMDVRKNQRYCDLFGQALKEVD